MKSAPSVSRRVAFVLSVALSCAATARSPPGLPSGRCAVSYNMRGCYQELILVRAHSIAQMARGRM